MPIIGILASAISGHLGLSVDALVIAGGGGGDDAGGGAGGVAYYGSTSLAFNTSFTVTVGAGGSGNQTGSDVSTSGSNSVFGALTAAVGGGRGCRGGGVF